MDRETRCHPSEFFTLRIWQEALGDGCSEWRGQLRHVPSGQTHYFRDWHALVALLLALLADLEPPSDGA